MDQLVGGGHPPQLGTSLGLLGGERNTGDVATPRVDFTKTTQSASYKYHRLSPHFFLLCVKKKMGSGTWK